MNHEASDIAAPVALMSPRDVVQDLYRVHRLALVRLGVLLLGDQGAAEDVVQDVFMAMWGKSLVPRDPALALAYLRRAVVNRSRSHVRRLVIARRKQPPPDVDGPTALERLELADEHREVIVALRKLPARQREVIVLRFYNELPVAEVADALGIHEGTVKSQAARGLAALRKLLAEGGAS